MANSLLSLQCSSFAKPRFSLKIPLFSAQMNECGIALAKLPRVSSQGFGSSPDGVPLDSQRGCFAGPVKNLVPVLSNGGWKRLQWEGFGMSRTGVRNSKVCPTAVSTEREDSAKTLQTGGGGGGIGGPNDAGGGGGGGGDDVVDWISSALIFAFWAGLLYYGATMAPNQTSYRDIYFIQKLTGLHVDDGFSMNKVLTAEFFMMGLWPLVYTSLLMPSGRSRKGVPVWPFAGLSFAVGAFALLPYFGLWRPPPPKVSREELSRWPLSLLESKVTAVVAIISAIVLLGYAGLAGADQWAEFSQYFRESRFIHVMTIDFVTLSTLCPFWVYNDLAVRKGSDDTSPLWALAFLPLLGPSIYLLVRPPLPTSMVVESKGK
ncbi:hypothetical protein R1flu_016919 [Riccia fluitans]|uniref:DUF2834 domain-containing protein n=1 Tax=Riccia fluitans TaxID=41844 RepID=A0ABD1YNH0_9MARC